MTLERLKVVSLVLLFLGIFVISFMFFYNLEYESQPLFQNIYRVLSLLYT
jgi:hypothetical protein